MPELMRSIPCEHGASIDTAVVPQPDRPILLMVRHDNLPQTLLNLDLPTACEVMLALADSIAYARENQHARA